MAILERSDQLDIGLYKIIRGRENKFGFGSAEVNSHILIAKDTGLLLNPGYESDQKPQVYDGGHFIYTGLQIGWLDAITDSCDIVTATGEIVKKNDVLKIQAIRRESTQILANLLLIEVLAYIPFTADKESFLPQK